MALACDIDVNVHNGMDLIKEKEGEVENKRIYCWDGRDEVIGL